MAKGRAFRKILSVLLLLVFVITSIRPSYAQARVELPPPGQMLAFSAPFEAPVLRGLKVYPKEPLRFDFILDKGDADGSEERLKETAVRLIKYFMASLTVPEKDLWVNLSPYEKDRIIPDGFGMTLMGRDLLELDYFLKQLTASAIYPEDASGKAFWNKVYARVYEKYGTTDIPLDSRHKVWIVPAGAGIVEKKDRVLIVNTRLKVMLETDYLALTMARQEGQAAGDSAPASDGQAQASSAISNEAFREIVIPLLEEEVNAGRTFAQLRMIYHALVLANWFKSRMKGSLLQSAYVDQQKVTGVDIEDKDEKVRIWEQYVQSFRSGVYDHIREEKDLYSEELIPRKYFSGGCNLTAASAAMTTLPSSAALEFVNKVLLVVAAGIALTGAELKGQAIQLNEDYINPQAEATAQPVRILSFGQKLTAEDRVRLIGEFKAETSAEKKGDILLQLKPLLSWDSLKADQDIVDLLMQAFGSEDADLRQSASATLTQGVSEALRREVSPEQKAYVLGMLESLMKAPDTIQKFGCFKFLLETAQRKGERLVNFRRKDAAFEPSPSEVARTVSLMPLIPALVAAFGQGSADIKVAVLDILTQVRQL